MENSDVYLVPLHEKPTLMQSCIKLLNDEWPRSETARMKSIENSNSKLPISILLVKTNQDTVIGHAKVNRMPLYPESCWIESVVIDPTCRGKGYGKLLMNACEQIARQLGFLTAVLSTHDKQEFYKKLGYEYCQPINMYGTKPLPLLSYPKVIKLQQKPSCSTSENITKETESSSSVSASFDGEPPLPPPPPPPPLPKHAHVPQSTKDYMQKYLC